VEGAGHIPKSLGGSALSRRNLIKRATALAAGLSTGFAAPATQAETQIGVTNMENREMPANPAVITSLADFTAAVSADRTVTRRAVTFKNGQIDMAGVIFTPATMEQGTTYPAIVIVHPGGGAKEQTASLYAWRLAQQGYVALAYDASHQNESGGEPRLLEDPTARVEDARSAVDYLTTLPFVDRERIAALGICAGGAYAINATMTDHRIKAVAGISSFNYGDGMRKGWRGTGTAEELRAMFQAVAEQRTAAANGAQPVLLPYVPDTTEGVTEPDMVEASEYYRLANRWKLDRQPNRFLASSNDQLIAFDAFNGIGMLLTQPLLLIAGSDAGSKWHSDRAFAEATSASEKELFVVPGGTHMSLYDRDVGKAMPRLLEFLGKHLGSSR
jgi:fermentation-respiration switch protein FrsA (DUF1100 family)